MPMDANEIERLIKARHSGCRGDDPRPRRRRRPLCRDRASPRVFRGKSRVQQHQIVYEALKAEMGGELHALALQTGTPER